MSKQAKADAKAEAKEHAKAEKAEKAAAAAQAKTDKTMRQSLVVSTRGPVAASTAALWDSARVNYFTCNYFYILLIGTSLIACADGQHGAYQGIDFTWYWYCC